MMHMQTREEHMVVVSSLINQVMMQPIMDGVEILKETTMLTNILVEALTSESNIGINNTNVN